MPRQECCSELGKKPLYGKIEGIVLGHKISTTRLEVDQAKVSMIETLMPPNTVKGISCFLGHVGCYRRFIKDFSKISRPLCILLESVMPVTSML